MEDRPTRLVPPGSTALRELLRAIETTLTLPNPETEAGELAYLRAHRDRSRLVLFAVRRVLADREAGDAELMAAASALRGEAGS